MNATNVPRWIALLGLIALSLTGISCENGTESAERANVAPGLLGAGATFPAPLYEKWIQAFEEEHPEIRITYQEIGSGEGIQKFLAEKVDFGASDAAMSDEEIARVDRGVQLVPMTAGSIVLAYNLQGVTDLKLPRDVYADIFLGKITQWTDPRIQAANPDQKFPKATIAVVVRLDSSGTTYAMTNHLSAISDEWNNGPGTGKLVGWPGGAMQARGNDGVAGRIKRTENSIGYVEYGTAERADLPVAWLENKAGRFVQPNADSGREALANVDLPPNLRVFLPDPKGDEAYPLVTVSWLLLYRKYDDPETAEQLKQWIHWCLQQGQQTSQTLGYIPLPDNFVHAATWALDNVK